MLTGVSKCCAQTAHLESWLPTVAAPVAASLAFTAVQVMYAYYASSCFGMRWPKFLARNITNLQLTQMFANLALLVATFYCCGPNSHISMWPSTAMYGVYAALFLDLFRQKYTGRAGKNTTERGAGGC